MKKMVIVADSSFVIETIRLALRSAAGLNLIGKVDGRAPVRRPIAESQPEIVLVDEMQSSEHALERIRECREEAPSSVILLLTMRMEDQWVSEALAAGADACLSKSAHLPSLGTLIREIVARNIVTAPPAALADGKLPLAGRRRPHRSRARDPRPGVRRAHQRPHRPRAVGHRADGQVPPVEHLPQARRVEPHRGEPLRLHARPAPPRGHARRGISRHGRRSGVGERAASGQRPAPPKPNVNRIYREGRACLAPALRRSGLSDCG